SFSSSFSPRPPARAPAWPTGCSGPQGCRVGAGQRVRTARGSTGKRIHSACVPPTHLRHDPSREDARDILSCTGLSLWGKSAAHIRKIRQFWRQMSAFLGETLKSGGEMLMTGVTYPSMAHASHEPSMTANYRRFQASGSAVSVEMFSG